MPGFVILAAMLLLFLAPLLFAQLMAAGLGKLGLDPGTAALLVMGIIVGGFINIPIRRIEHGGEVDVHPFAAFGLSGLFPQMRRVRRDTIIAINVGGCVIPVVLAAYELSQLTGLGGGLLASTIIATGLNTAVCYYVARPVPGIGIMMPGLLSPLVAAGLALLLAPHEAPPVAFVAGVLGPLIGADLLHLKDFGSRVAGMVSIGGAGTFDGIVLSGILAAYLA
ncbi:MAG TPA: DUF1614 domain-containing protein [Alphaproteobacteria bacterium]|nr:DUF1614 domain-containing protein [Alphaproteobacteria bacterium]